MCRDKIKNFSVDKLCRFEPNDNPLEFTTFFLDPISGVDICYHPLVTLLTHFQKNGRKKIYRSFRSRRYTVKIFPLAALAEVHLESFPARFARGGTP